MERIIASLGRWASMESVSDRELISIGRPENFEASIISVTVVPCYGTPSSHRLILMGK
jgi:hypothetical protein